MKKSLFLKSCLFVATAIFAASCDEDVTLGTVDTGNLAVPDGEVVYITDASGKRNYSNLEFRDTQTTPLYVNAPSSVSSETKVAFTYDPTVLDEYNNTYGTSFAALPEDVVTFANGGVATLAAGDTKAQVDMTLASNGELDSNTIYALPIKISAVGGAKLGDADASKVIFVRDLTGLPDATKYVTDESGNLVPGIKVFSCMEVNDANPLNHLSFTLKNSGKPLFDAVILFSSNINFNETTGRVYVKNNENVQAILSNYDKYVKPLKDRGIKVLLSILGNHDQSGISQLSEAASKEFAKDIKAMCDTYDLDGVFWDDEYSLDYGDRPGFEFGGDYTVRVSRLIYEVWKLQPQRWNIAYVWSTTYNLVEVDGVLPGVYCEYALHNYGGSWDLSEQYPGMPKSHMGLYSQEFAQSNIASLSNLQKMRNDGYGAHMIFAFEPLTQAQGGNRTDWNVSRQLSSLQNVAKAFFDDELVDDEIRYTADWK